MAIDQHFDPGSPTWTFLETAYAASAGAETTYVHPGVVTSPPAPSGGGGGTGGPPAPSAMTATSSPEDFGLLIWPWELDDNRPPYPWEAQLWNAAHGYLLIESSTETQSMSANSSAMQQPGTTGFYFVLRYGEDSDNDGLPNGIELEAGLNFLSADSDGDSLADGSEDLDSDGVINFDEVWSGTLIQEADSQYPPPPLPFGDVFYFEETFTLSPSTAPQGGAEASLPESQEMLFLDAGPETAYGVTALETSPGVLHTRLHAIYIGPDSDASTEPNTSANPPQNPFPKPSEEQMALLRAANGETDIAAGQIGNIRQDLYDQLQENTLDWASWQAEYGLRKTERLLQEVETGQRPASEPFKRGLRANIITQSKRLTAATSTLARKFGRAIGRHLPLIGGIMILTSASAIAEDWNDALQFYALNIRNGDDTTGSAAIIAGHCNDLAPGSGNIVLNYLLR